MKILVTGGAGFIGTHLVRRLLRLDSEVTVLDNFSPQIHGNSRALASDVAPHVRLLVGDIQDQVTVAKAVRGQDAIVHLAAETGTGQSMYEVVRYERVNIGGTAILLQAIAEMPENTLRRLVVASSRSIYGEGAYETPGRITVFPEQRKVSDIRAGLYEPLDAHTGQPLTPIPTSEDAPTRPSSIYGLTKKVQEEMCLLWAKTLGFSAFALRFQNVYGPGQSLKNPYTGILAIFSNQARLNNPINIFEDGQESRDFVYIDDVVDSIVAATFHCGDDIVPINIGSGVRTTVCEVVNEITLFFNSSSPVSISGAFRQGDIRHCFADLERAKSILNYCPKWNFREGIMHFLGWVSSQEVSEGGYAASIREMKEKGLFHDK